MQHPYEIATDRRRLDVALIHRFLSESDWAQGIPREVVQRSIDNSLCFGAFSGPTQVGFARVVTDFAAIAYLADVFVVEAHRGRGVAGLLLRAILDHPDLQRVRRLLLATRDAHGLYARFGFEPLAHPEHFMTVHRPEVHRGERTA